MFVLKKLLTALVLPPFGLLLLAVAGLLLLRYRPRLGRFIALGALVLLMTLSLPQVANRLLRSLETFQPIEASSLATAQAIVVLGAGSYINAPEYGGDTVSSGSLVRLRYAARLYRQTGLPLLVTGGAPFGGRPEGELMREALKQDFGIPVRWAEIASGDTAENAAFSSPLLHQAGIQRIALVTHAWHMPRSVEWFRRQGFEVIPAPTCFTSDMPASVANLLPSSAALDGSRLALHEWLGQLVQRVQR